jgi:hypothetical protein
VASKIDEHLTHSLTWLGRKAQTSEGLCWILLAFGLFLRVHEYFQNRVIYLDESALLENIRGVPVFDLSPLSREQLAPPAFLVVERMMCRLLGDSRLALRLFPLLCSIVSLELMRRVAFRMLDRRAVPVAMGLFAVSYDLIYYASEIKQYSTDVLCALAALLIGERLRSGFLKPGLLVLVALLGAVMIWSSYASVFVLAGVGAVLLIAAIRRRDARFLIQVLLLGLFWGVNALGCYFISRMLLEKPEFMQFFWGPVAFPSLDIGSHAGRKALAWHILNLYINPLDFQTPLGEMPSLLLGLLLTVVGAIALGRRDAARLGMLGLPIVFAFSAGVLHAYPFHGRLLTYLIPAFHIFMAAGLFAIGRRLSARLWVLLAALLLVPALWDAILQLSRARERATMTHGDLRRDLWFDYVPTPIPPPGHR